MNLSFKSLLLAVLILHVVSATSASQFGDMLDQMQPETA